MKLIATTLMMTILCLMPIQAQDRDNIDGNLRVKYLYFFKEDSTMQGFYADSSMCLDVTPACRIQRLLRLRQIFH